MTLLDGAIYHNNPVKVANAEWKQIWVDGKDKKCGNHKHPDILLSVGAGYIPAQETKDTTSSQPPKPGILGFGRAVIGFGHDHAKYVLSGQRIWEEFLSAKNPSLRHSLRYRRLNVPLNADGNADSVLVDIKALQRLAQERMGEDLEKDAKTVARQLIASSFFFHHQQKVPSIECRFYPERELIKKFLRHLASLLVEDGRESLRFQFQLSGTVKDSNSVRTLDVELQELDRMANSGRFSKAWDDLTIDSDQKFEVSVLLLPEEEKVDKYLPISGFPRSFA